MKLSVAIIAATSAVASAKRSLKNMPEDLSNVEIKAESKVGSSVLSKARRLDGGDDAFTWIAGYSLKFQSCVSYQDYYGGNGNYNNGDGNNGGNYNYNGNANGQYDGQYNANNQDGQYQYGNGNYNGENGNDNNGNDNNGMYNQQLVRFKLCPSDSCFRCKNGAEYVVELNDFVNSYLEAQMTAQEYECEVVRENCYCENAYSEETCEYNCFKNANMENCVEAMYEQEQEFDLQEAIECLQIEVEDEDTVRAYFYKNDWAKREANLYYGQNGQNYDDMDDVGDLYVGPYCSTNGKKIHLGLFMEETCSYSAPDGLYEAMHYGDSLPYAKKSIVDHSCMSCMEPKDIDYNNYWDQEDADEVKEVCYELYEIAGKCETGLDGYFPYRDVTGCGFIQSLQSSTFSLPSASIPAKVFAGIFAVTTAALAGVSMVLFKRNRRQNVSLAGDAIIS